MTRNTPLRRPVPLYQGLRPGQGTALERPGRPARSLPLRPGDDIEPSPTQRMMAVLDAIAYGLYPPADCRACRESTEDRCRGCTRALAGVATANGGIAAVDGAESQADALAAYTACMLGLVGSGGGGVASGECGPALT
jgi:hypothetical protein